MLNASLEQYPVRQWDHTTLISGATSCGSLYKSSYTAREIFHSNIVLFLCCNIIVCTLEFAYEVCSTDSQLLAPAQGTAQCLRKVGLPRVISEHCHKLNLLQRSHFTSFNSQA